MTTWVPSVNGWHKNEKLYTHIINDYNMSTCVTTDNGTGTSVLVKMWIPSFSSMFLYISGKRLDCNTMPHKDCRRHALGSIAFVDFTGNDTDDNWKELQITGIPYSCDNTDTDISDIKVDSMCKYRCRCPHGHKCHNLVTKIDMTSLHNHSAELCEIRYVIN